MTGRRVKMGCAVDSLVKTYGSRYLTDWRQLSDESKTLTVVEPDVPDPYAPSADFSEPRNSGYFVVMFEDI